MNNEVKTTKRFSALLSKLKDFREKIISAKSDVLLYQRQFNQKISAKEGIGETLKALRGAVKIQRKLSSDFRHHHIAYCELRHRTRDQIEKPTERAPKLNEKRISRIKKSFASAE